MTTKYLMYGRNFFLASAIRRSPHIPTSLLEGLHRRFPQAWMNRQTYPFINHPLFATLSLEQEFITNLCYCLVEYSTQDEALGKEIKQLITRIDRKTYQALKASKAQYLTKYETFFTTKFTARGAKPEALTDTAVLDYFMEILGLDYPEEWRESYCKEWEKASHFYLDMASEQNQGVLSRVEKDLKNSKSENFKQVTQICQHYSVDLEEPLVEYLSRYLFNAEATGQSGEDIPQMIARVFGLHYSLIDVEDRLTQQDVHNIIGTLTFIRQVHQHKLGVHSHKMSAPDLFDFIDKHLIYHSIFYLMSKIQSDNRNFFFKMYSTQDTVTLRSLEREVKQLKKELKSEREKGKQLEKNLGQVKVDAQKQIQQRLKQQEESLIEANRLLKKKEDQQIALEQENEQLRQLVQILQEQLSDKEDKEEQPITVDLEVLNQPEVLIIGGHPNLISKLKEKLPKCKFCEVDKSYKDDFFKGVKLAYILKDYVNHGMVYQVNKATQSKKRILTATNLDRIIEQMKENYVN